jgi:hypothetical protein
MSADHDVQHFGVECHEISEAEFLAELDAIEMTQEEFDAELDHYQSDPTADFEFGDWDAGLWPSFDEDFDALEINPF